MDGRWARVMPNINFWMTGCSVLQSVDALHSIDNVITATVKNCCPDARQYEFSRQTPRIRDKEHFHLRAHPVART
eukprot:scaffold42552_cov86-Phaeocystis_antarctica.AAC.1